VETHYKSQDLKNLLTIFAFFGKKRPLMVKFSKSSSESVYGDTD